MGKFLEISELIEKNFIPQMSASAFLGISHKTLQRWAESGECPVRNIKGCKKRQKINIEVRKTRTGRRYYSVESIKKLKDLLDSMTIEV